MYARHPEIAKRWRKESGPQKGLPEYSPKSQKPRTKRKGDEKRQQMITRFLHKQRAQHG